MRLGAIRCTSGKPGVRELGVSMASLARRKYNREFKVEAIRHSAEASRSVAEAVCCDKVLQRRLTASVKESCSLG